VRILAGKFAAGEQAEYALAEGRHAFVHVARGKAKLNGQELSAGDAAQVSDLRALEISGVDESEVLLFDLS